MGGLKNNDVTLFPFSMLLCSLLCLVNLGLSFSPVGPASRLWLWVPFLALFMGLALVWRYRWVAWVSSASSVLSLLVAFIAAESNLSLTALSFLYLFVQA